MPDVFANITVAPPQDPSPYLIDKARTLSTGAPNVVFEVGDGKALRFKDASFATSSFSIRC